MGAGKRTGEKKRTGFRADLMLLALGITFAIVAWGYLVVAAIDFGAKARHDGVGAAWFYLVLAALGAMFCLFLGFMLAVRLSRVIGLTAAPERPQRDPSAPKGGKRAAR